MDYRIFNVRIDANACDCTRNVRTPKESLHWKLTLGEKKFLAAPGNQTCVSGVPVRCFTSWATSPPPKYIYIVVFMCVTFICACRPPHPLRKRCVTLLTWTPAAALTSLILIHTLYLKTHKHWNASYESYLTYNKIKKVLCIIVVFYLNCLRHTYLKQKVICRTENVRE